MAYQKPTILIVPGACTLPSLYDGITSYITKAGYEIVVPQLRTVVAKTPAATFHDDAEYMHSQIETLADEGKDIVVVMHSYGGQPGTEAAKGLVKPDRVKEGKQGGIVRLVYLTSLAAAVGESMGLVNQREGLEFDFLKVDGDYFSQQPEASAKTNFSDLPLEQGIEEAKKMPWHSLKAFEGELTYPAYNFVPVSYIKTTRDLCLPPWWQDNRIRTIEESSGNKVDVHLFEADHCCNISNPVETAEIILRIAAATK
ncbi:alpha/beta-hydrolase [Polychaeton citri CBS 116435]|uniref:Alpha/beta-hydrolase n=1 Tax=Polychaeton citri CBS 116435 TaxID=1314669 RepID=A0A9P4QDQ5_9PEZI|nr:alpha/beta-hydrolase [Polychaeton citri CBS 116435]